MTFPTSGPTAGSNPLGQPPDFSLVLGGRLFQRLRRARLIDDALLLLRQRIVVFALFTWLPLLLLSALEGQLLGNGVAVPFLLDLEAHIRFRVALPLLIAFVYGVVILVVWRHYGALPEQPEGRRLK
jgi:hypothetical protein